MTAVAEETPNAKLVGRRDDPRRGQCERRAAAHRAVVRREARQLHVDMLEQLGGGGVALPVEAHLEGRGARVGAGRRADLPY